MKKLFLQVLALFFFAGALAQTDLDPCCNILKINVAKNIITARDNNTGRLYHFTADAGDLSSYKINDAVNISSGMMGLAGGSKKAYTEVKPDPVEPCCAVVSVEPNPVEPCCCIVAFKNNSTGLFYRFQAPKQITALIKADQVLYREPANNIAIVNVPYGNTNGELSSYGYPIIEDDEAGALEKWERKPVKGLKKATGRLNLNFPKAAEWSVDIYSSANKFIINKSIGTWKLKYYDLPVGPYNIRINTVMIEGVSIEENKETILKTGLLNIKSADWELRSEDNKKFFTSGNKARFIVMPVGRYLLEEGRNNKRIIEVNQVVNPGVYTKKTGDYPSWVIMKSPEASELTDLKGLVSMVKIPKDTTIRYTTPDGEKHSITLPLNIHASIRTIYGDSILPRAYIAGTIQNGEMYYYPQQIRLNNASYGNIPVFENLETRLKVGFLIITKKKEEDLNDNWLYEHLMGTNQTGTYTWELETSGGHKIKSGEKSITLALPPGEYILVKKPPEYSHEDRITYSITITAGQWVKNGVKQSK